MAKGKKSSGRELVKPKGKGRFVRRDDRGRFGEVDVAERALPQDVRKRAKKTVRSGQGDRGDRKR